MNEKSKEQLLEEIHSELTLFFLDNDFDTTTKELWEWFTGYVYHRGEVIDGKEVAGSLFFYERLLSTITSIKDLLCKIKELQPAPAIAI